MNYDNMNWEELAKYAAIDAKTPLEIALAENFKDLLEGMIKPEPIDEHIEVIKEALDKIDSLIWQ